jgi:hypothetical protein
MFIANEDIHTYIHTYTYIHIYIHIHTYIHTSTYIHTYIHAHTYVWYIHIYICIYIRIYTSSERARAGVCWRMLTYAVYTQQRIHLLRESESSRNVIAPRMLTYAEVCWSMLYIHSSVYTCSERARAVERHRTTAWEIASTTSSLYTAFSSE